MSLKVIPTPFFDPYTPIPESEAQVTPFEGVEAKWVLVSRVPLILSSEDISTYTHSPSSGELYVMTR